MRGMDKLMAQIDYWVQQVGPDSDNMKSRLVRVGYTVDDNGCINTRPPYVDVADFRDEEEAAVFQHYLDTLKSRCGTRK